MFMRISLVIAALAACVVASASAGSAAFGSPAPGVWSGKTHQELAPLAEDAEWVTWTQRIVVRTLNGRLTGITGSFRYTCPDPENPMAGDVRLAQGWKVDVGPKLSAANGFAITLSKMTVGKTVYPLYAPITIRGTLGKSGASGRFELSNADCSGKGRWQARRVY